MQDNNNAPVNSGDSMQADTSQQPQNTVVPPATDQVTPAAKEAMELNQSKNKMGTIVIFMLLLMIVFLGVAVVYLLTKDGEEVSNDDNDAEPTVEVTEEPINDENDVVPSINIESIDCFTDCTLEDLQERIDELELETEYISSVSEGYACSDKYDITFNNGDWITTIVNEGHEQCYTPSGLSLAFVDNQDYYKLPGGNWESGLALNENGSEYRYPEEALLTNILPQGDLSTSGQYDTTNDNGVTWTTYYTDEIITEPTDIPSILDGVAVIALKRFEGIEQCVTQGGGNGLGDCVTNTWFFDENLYLVGYIQSGLEYGYLVTFTEYGNTEPIPSPI